MRYRATVAAIAAFSIFAAARTAYTQVVRIEGRVAHGQEFSADFGRDFKFVLHPDETGWTIEVRPKSSDCGEFVWVATPPFRFSNVRYVNTDYAIPAAQAVKYTPREFQFVTSCVDYQAEADRLEFLLWPGAHSEAEVNEARAKPSAPTGMGKLWILESHISPKTISGRELGEIDWMRFRVELRLPAKSSGTPERTGVR